jgi:hypothetical protein
MLSTSLRGLPRGRLVGAMLTRQDEAAKTQIVQYVYTKMKNYVSKCEGVDAQRRLVTESSSKKVVEVAQAEE